MRIHRQKSSHRHIKEPVCKIWVDHESNKVTQLAMKVSLNFQNVELDTAEENADMQD